MIDLQSLASATLIPHVHAHTHREMSSCNFEGVFRYMCIHVDIDFSEGSQYRSVIFVESGQWLCSLTSCLFVTCQACTCT